MKYLSIDIETTGLDPETCQIIEFAAVADDLNNQLPIENLPKFQTYIYHDLYQGEAYALGLHSEIFKKLANLTTNGINVCNPDMLMSKFCTFLTTLCGYEHSLDGSGVKINVAGKNFANFDNKFLSKLPYGGVRFNHRVLDPVMLYFNPLEDMKQLPSTETCMKRAGIPGTSSHTALEDAIMVVRLLREALK